VLLTPLVLFVLADAGPLPVMLAIWLAIWVRKSLLVPEVDEVEVVDEVDPPMPADCRAETIVEVSVLAETPLVCATWDMLCPPDRALCSWLTLIPKAPATADCTLSRTF